MGVLIFYLIFIFIGLITGIVFLVLHKYYIPAVIAFIFAIFSPLLTLLITAQRDAGTGIYAYIKSEVSAGNTFVRILVVMHVFLIVWLLFLLTRGIIYLIQSPKVKETVTNQLSRLRKQSE